MLLFARPENFRTQRLLAIAKTNELDVEVKCDQPSGDMYMKIPVLDTGKGCIFSSDAIGRYLSRMRPDIGLYGNTFVESGEVDSWVSYSSSELEPPICAWTFPMDGIFPEVTQASAAAQIDVHESLMILDKHLAHRTFIVGEKLTFADLHIASVLHRPTEVHKCLDSILQDMTHLKRWYRLITMQPGFVAAFGKVVDGPKAEAGKQGKGGKGVKK